MCVLYLRSWARRLDTANAAPVWVCQNSVSSKQAQLISALELFDSARMTSKAGESYLSDALKKASGGSISTNMATKWPQIMVAHTGVEPVFPP